MLEGGEKRKEEREEKREKRNQNNKAKRKEETPRPPACRYSKDPTLTKKILLLPNEANAEY